MSNTQLWLAFVALGGDLLLDEVVDVTLGLRQATRAEHDVIAAALNEHFADHGQDHPVPIWNDLPRSA